MAAWKNVVCYRRNQQIHSEEPDQFGVDVVRKTLSLTIGTVCTATTHHANPMRREKTDRDLEKSRK